MITNIEKNVRALTNIIFRDLEIVSYGDRMKTGKDAAIILNGNPIHEYLGISRMDWEIIPYEKYGTIKLTCCRANGQILFNKEKQEIEDYVLTIDKPIKKIHIDYKGLSVISDNTPLNTKIIKNGRDITKDLSIGYISSTIGDADTITELQIILA